MSAYETRLIARRDLASGTQEFRFRRPAGFDFKAGQAIDLMLPGIEGGHAFSLVNAPYDDELAIATRMRDSAYKRALKALAPGAGAHIDGPFGSLTLHRNAAREAVFLAGGIGITPFMSMLRHVAHERLEHRVVLVYSNRRPEDAAYLDELVALEEAQPWFRLVATMTEMAKSALPWSGERRLVDAALVRSATTGLAAPIFYVAGPPGMVESLRATLAAAGVDEDDVRSEEFFGYETALKDERDRAEAA